MTACVGCSSHGEICTSCLRLVKGNPAQFSAMVLVQILEEIRRPKTFVLSEEDRARLEEIKVGFENFTRAMNGLENSLHGGMRQ